MPGSTDLPPTDAPIALTGVILAVEISSVMPEAFRQDPDASLIVAKFPAVTPELLARVRPDAVLCPLMAPGFDAAQMIERLDGIGYRGPLYALSGPLPNPAIVEAELRQIAPAIDLRLVALPR